MSSIVARNLMSDPRSYHKREYWAAKPNAVEVGLNGPVWRYAIDPNVDSARAMTVWAWGKNVDLFPSGQIVFAIVQSNNVLGITSQGVEYCEVIEIGDYVNGNKWIAARCPGDRLPTLSLAKANVVLKHTGIYTPEDWQYLHDQYERGRISIPWLGGPQGLGSGVKAPWDV